MKLRIITDKVKSLRLPSEEVALPLSNEDSDRLFSMLEYLKHSQDEEYAAEHNIRPGVGLASPQTGVNKKMLVVYYKDEDDKEIEHLLVNPRIISTSVKLTYIKNGEGCLSVPDDHEGYVYRPYKIIVNAYDAKEKKNVEIKAKGFEAIVLQHEIDHLKGILYYDHINKNNPFEEKDNAVMI